MPGTFAEAVSRVSDDVARALTRMETGAAPDAELRSLRGYLVDLLEFTEPNPGLEAACDDLFGAASAFVASKLPSESRRRLLREAYLRFQTQLASAAPGEMARHMGLL